jgi:hypothetical protein
MVGSNGIVQPPPPPDGRSACRRSQRLRTRPAAFRGSSRHGRSPTDFRGSVASQTYGPSHRRLGRAGLEPANAALARSQVRPRAATNESGLRLTGHDTIADALADASTTSHLSGSRLWVRQPSSPRDRYGGRHVHGRRCAPMIDDTQTLPQLAEIAAAFAGFAALVSVLRRRDDLLPKAVHDLLRLRLVMSSGVASGPTRPSKAPSSRTGSPYGSRHAWS